MSRILHAFGGVTQIYFRGCTTKSIFGVCSSHSCCAILFVSQVACSQAKLNFRRLDQTQCSLSCGLLPLPPAAHKGVFRTSNVLQQWRQQPPPATLRGIPSRINFWQARRVNQICSGHPRVSLRSVLRGIPVFEQPRCQHCVYGSSSQTQIEA